MSAAEPVKQKRVAREHEEHGESGARAEDEKEDEAARDFQEIREHGEKRVGKEDLKLGDVVGEAPGKIAAAKLVEQTARHAEQTFRDARFEAEHDLVDGGVHDALPEERLRTDRQHQQAGDDEQIPDAAGFARGQGVDEAFLDDRQHISGRRDEQNAREHADIDPAPRPHRAQKEARKIPE